MTMYDFSNCLSPFTHCLCRTRHKKLILESDTQPSATSQSTSIYPTRLNTADKEIRLLEILPDDDKDSQVNCTLSTARCFSGNPYNALSYTWGDKSLTKELIVNGHKIDVTVNLYLALHQLRERQRSTGMGIRLWADAVSINQKDLQERTEQVSMMGDIYSQAAEIIVWLGPKGEYTEAAFQHFHSWKDFLLKESLENPVSPTIFLEKKYPYPQTDVMLGLHDIFGDRKWWTRLWTLQEIVLAKKATVICGSSEIDWEMLCSVLKTWLSSTSSQVVSSLGKVGGPYGTNNFPWPVIDLLLALDILEVVGLNEFHKQGGRPRFGELIHFTERRKCMDPRDRIFGLLGLSPATTLVNPDYSRPAEMIYTEAFRNEIKQTNRLELLVLAGVGAKSEAFENEEEQEQFKLYQSEPDHRVVEHWEERKQKASNLPSWVRDFSWPRDSGDSDHNHVFHKLVQAWPSGLSACGGISGTKVAVFPGQNPHLAAFRGILCGTVSDVESLIQGEKYYAALWRYRQLARRVRWKEEETNYHLLRVLLLRSRFPRTPLHQLQSLSPIAAFFRVLITEFDEENFGHDQRGLGDSPGVRALQLIVGYCKILLNADDVDNLDERLEAINEDSKDLAASVSQFGVTLTEEMKKQEPGRERLKATIRGHNAIFSTDDGYIGSGPAGIQVGDLICILGNCPLPMIIRRQSDHYLLVGPAFVYGMMHGEMLVHSKERWEWLVFL